MNNSDQSSQNETFDQYQNQDTAKVYDSIVQKINMDIRKPVPISAQSDNFLSLAHIVNKAANLQNCHQNRKGLESDYKNRESSNSVSDSNQSDNEYDEEEEKKYYELASDDQGITSHKTKVENYHYKKLKKVCVSDFHEDTMSYMDLEEVKSSGSIDTICRIETKLSNNSQPHHQAYNAKGTTTTAGTNTKSFECFSDMASLVDPQDLALEKKSDETKQSKVMRHPMMRPPVIISKIQSEHTMKSLFAKVEEKDDEDIDEPKTPVPFISFTLCD